MKFVIHVDGNIPLQVLADALASKGLHLRSDSGGRTVVEAIPTMVRKEEPVAAVVEAKPDEKVAHMPGRVRVVK